jgi:hypothetical protein
MAFFISYTLYQPEVMISAWEPMGSSSQGMLYERELIKGMIRKMTSAEEI